MKKYLKIRNLILLLILIIGIVFELFIKSYKIEESKTYKFFENLRDSKCYTLTLKSHYSRAYFADRDAEMDVADLKYYTEHEHSHVDDAEIFDVEFYAIQGNNPDRKIKFSSYGHIYHNIKKDKDFLLCINDNTDYHIYSYMSRHDEQIYHTHKSRCL